MSQITVEVIQASVGPNEIPIHTARMTYPRFIHAEVKTHRRVPVGNETWIIEQEVGLMDDVMLSRNAASSRAIPIPKMLDQIRNDPASPVHWGKNQSGMQARQELEGLDRISAEDWWLRGAAIAAEHVESCPVPLHKQVSNRVLEPWMMMTVIVTATDWQNFFCLREHEDAQPEILALAKALRKAIDEAPLFELKAGELHVPFVHRLRLPNGCPREKIAPGGLLYYVDTEGPQDIHLTPAQALKVSASCAAQSSFRALDFSVPKAESIYDKLVESKPVHASPFEHQAIAVSHPKFGNPEYWPAGITHMDRTGEYWSGNLRGWVQNRQLINGHHVPG